MIYFPCFLLAVVIVSVWATIYVYFRKGTED